MRASLRPARLSPASPWLMSWAVCVAAMVTVAGPGGVAGVAESVAAATVLLATAVLAVRTLSALSLPHKNHQTLRRTLRARVLRAGAIRYCDPDAPGRPRPRAPGALPSAS